MLAGVYAVALLVPRGEAATMAFAFLLNPGTGPVNNILGSLGLPQPGWFNDPNWSKPALGIMSTKDAPETNLISPFGNASGFFLDEHGPAEERFKAFLFDELPPGETGKGPSPGKLYGLFGIVSPDGLRWRMV